MEDTRHVNVAIVGGGAGCKAIMDMIFAEKLSGLRMRLVGVADLNPEAAGYRYAKEKGIYTTANYLDFYKLPHLGLLIELTGSDEVANELYKNRPDNIRLIDHVVARLFWDIFQMEEDVISERRRHEGELEERVNERTSQLALKNQELMTEIKERLRIDAALQESEDRFRTLFEHSPVPIWEEDFSEVKRRLEYLQSSGVEDFRAYFTSHPDEVVHCAKLVKVLDVNRESLEFFKTRNKEDILRDLPFFFVENSWDIFREEMVAIAEGSMKFECEMPIRTLTGSRKIVALRLSIAPRFKDTLSRVLVSFVDITELKRIEQSLRESEAKYSSLVEQARDGVFILQDDVVKFSNRALAKILGYDVQELIGTPVSELNPPDLPSGIAEKYRKRMAGEEVPPLYETRIRGKDGSVKDVEISAELITYDGRLADIGSVRDVTERKRIEEELLKAQKLESIGILAGGIAHDFNNLLVGILGNISLAKLLQKLEPKVHQRLNEAEEAALQAKELTNQLLTFARGGAPIKKSISISKFLRDRACFAVRGSNVKCEFILPEGLWPVEVDEGQLTQVVNNLTINSKQAMPEGGTIKVYAQNIELNGEGHIPLRKGRYVKISFEDCGTGIPEENLQKIFDPYFTTKEKGRGLGLAVTRSIINRHGGHIDVESKIGAGTTFRIFLPASEHQVCDVSIDGGRPDRADIEGRILIMDDEQLVRDVACEILQFLGYKVTLAKDGADAVELYRKAKESGRPFDAVILDLTVPGAMGGKEAIVRLKQLDPEVKGIVSSGYSDDPIMTDFRAYGFVGVIAKPYQMAELGEVLQKVVQKGTGEN